MPVKNSEDATATAQVTAWNHWVPQWYLRRWSTDGNTIQVYETLVPHVRYPVWEARAIRSQAAANHLYTSSRDAEKPDAFETYLKNEIEEPALDALDKAARGAPLSTEEHDRITRYAVALDQRTPPAYFEQLQRWNKDMPRIIRSTLDHGVAELERRARSGVKTPEPPPQKERFPVTVKIRRAKESGMAEVGLSLTLGRELWIWSMRHALEHTAPKIIANGGIKWSVSEPRAGRMWFTSDHPLLRVNYHGDGKYDFGGGWGFKGSEIALPISPSALLYAKVGEPFPSRFQMDRGPALTLQWLLARRAYHAIYSTEPSLLVEHLRPRLVDREQFENHRDQLREWHDNNMKAEQEDGTNVDDIIAQEPPNPARPTLGDDVLLIPVHSAERPSA